MSREEGRNGVTWMGSQTLLLKQVLETFRIVWERLLNVCGLGLLDRLRWRRGGVLDSFGGRDRRCRLLHFRRQVMHYVFHIIIHILPLRIHSIQILLESIFFLFFRS